jgi:hypothetical protein
MGVSGDINMNAARLAALVVGWLIGCTTVFAQGKALNYQQEKLLKDAVSYLDEAENYITQLEGRIKDLKVGDSSVPIENVKSWLNYAKTSSERLEYAKNRFDQLPADNAEVKPELDRLAPLTESLAKVDAKLKELEAGLMKVVQQGEGSGFQADFDRLREITQTYGDPQLIQRRPEAAIEVIKQMAAVKAERQRIAEKYADLLKQNTNHSEQMQGTLRYFDDTFRQFEQATQDYASRAPAEIDGNVAQAIQMGKDASANQNPAFFGPQGGVTEQLGYAQARLDVFTAIAPDTPQVKQSAEKLAAARVEVDQMQAALLEQIVQNNQPPAEPYSGPDKDQLVEIIKTKWTESGVTAEVLKIGINSQNWQRDVYWEWDGTDTWNKTDKSRIQGFVIVRLNDTLAATYHVNLVKDHLSSDRIDAYFFDDPKSEPIVLRKFPLDKLQ